MSPGPVPGVDLRDGEELLWTGQPDPSVLFTRADVFLVPFTLLWGGGVWTGTVVSLLRGTGGSVVTVLGGTPFLLLGFYLVVGRFLLKRRTRKLTHYAVTDRRAVVACCGRASEVDLRTAVQAVRHRRDAHHATVVFGIGSRFFTPGRTGRTGLDFISSTWRQRFAFYDVADVEGLTSALRTASERSG